MFDFPTIINLKVIDFLGKLQGNDTQQKVFGENREDHLFAVRRGIISTFPYDFTDKCTAFLAWLFPSNVITTPPPPRPPPSIKKKDGFRNCEKLFHQFLNDLSGCSLYILFSRYFYFCSLGKPLAGVMPFF